MKRLNIFKAGTHIAANGAKITFSEDDLRKAVEAYDPGLHEAPIVVGHPKDNLPAYGWVKSLAYGEDGLDAVPDQVDEQFSELVEKGRFKKISASFYTPDSPANPKPGQYYLRHVGFLGAQPPAIKGLKGVEFNEAEEGVVEFSDYSMSVIGRLFRSMRDWIISEKGIDEADKVIPDFYVQDLEFESRQPIQETPEPAFAEPTADRSKPEMTDKTIEQQKADLEALQADLEKREADFAEREKAIKAKEAENIRAQNSAYVEKQIEAGKVLPAMKERMVEFMCSLSDETVVEFGEGEKQTAVETFKTLIEANKPVDFEERSKEDGHGDGPATIDPQELAKKAADFRESEAKAGRTVSTTAAVEHILKTEAQA